jgi:hypothetical protein
MPNATEVKKSTKKKKTSPKKVPPKNNLVEISTDSPVPSSHEKEVFCWWS